VNIGSHRWAFKPESGLSIPRGAWEFDVYDAVWLSTPNDEYYPGGSRRQQNLVTIAVAWQTGWAPKRGQAQSASRNPL
jgi:hypothetical protein